MKAEVAGIEYCYGATRFGYVQHISFASGRAMCGVKLVAWWIHQAEIQLCPHCLRVQAAETKRRSAAQTVLP